MGFRGFADSIVFSCGFAEIYFLGRGFSVSVKSAEHGFCCFLTTVFGETTNYLHSFRFSPDFRFLFTRKHVLKLLTLESETSW